MLLLFILCCFGFGCGILLGTAFHWVLLRGGHIEQIRTPGNVGSGGLAPGRNFFGHTPKLKIGAKSDL